LAEKAVAPEKSEKPEKPEKAEKPQKGEKKAAKAPEAPKKKEHPDNFRFIVRMVNTDINGELSVMIGLTKIKGIGLRASQTIIKLAGLNPSVQIGTLDDASVAKLEETIGNYVEIVPGWMVNRQHDWESGDDMHLVGIDVEVVLRDDINRMKMIRCYRGIRHERGQKVRGQRTRSNGRTGLQVGVIRQKLAPAQAGEKSAEKATEKAAPKVAAKVAPKVAPKVAEKKGA
jgi:small subunit ribosomal protein S13